jgi:uncharacterized protein (TIGR00297 family)
MASLFTLDISGTLLALLFGITIFYLGLGMWWFFIAILIEFLVLSSLATHAKEDSKASLKGYEKVRSWKNVVANGVVPVLVVVAYFLFESVWGISPIHAEIMVYAFVASVAAITADKFASEFGVLGLPEPVDLITGKKVKRGTSGGVTWFGTFMGFVASFLIGFAVFALGASIVVFVVVVLAGMFGNLVDSVLGHFEEKKIGNKYTSNLVCAVGGALFCAVVLYLLPVSLLI